MSEQSAELAAGLAMLEPAAGQAWARAWIERAPRSTGPYRAWLTIPTAGRPAAGRDLDELVARAREALRLSIGRGRGIDS